MVDSTADFASRHIGPTPADTDAILATLGYDSPAALAAAALPPSIAIAQPLQLPAGLAEHEVLAALREFATANTVKQQLVGQGFYDTITPAVIRRNIVENPAWYTAYTPYQPEISQGRLEALLNFQTMVSDLTGLPVANASLLDEATAAAEAVQLMARAAKKRERVLVDAACHPQIITVIRGRAGSAGIPVTVAELDAEAVAAEDLAGVLIANPTTTGEVRDLTELIASAKTGGALVTVVCDLLAQVLLTAPGSLGADIAVGSAQRFGVPLFFGGPHAGFMAVTEALQRQLPGRLVGVSKDADGKPAYRLALQTREQHIRRDKATSNICTAQALLAVIASMYAVWHGPAGLRAIAVRLQSLAAALTTGLRAGGVATLHDSHFDTIVAHVPGAAERLLVAAETAGFNLRLIDADHLGISVGESTTQADIATLIGVLTDAAAPAEVIPAATLAAAVLRTDEILTHPVFHQVSSETQMMRYLRMLSDRDLALDRTMIPLGSCTMKLNSAVEMEAITWPEFAGIHPYAPSHQTAGWQALLTDLEQRLAAITGYAKVSLQPNSGAQGELAGLMAITRYHRANGQPERRICVIPQSAHGTNAASAALAGLKVVTVATAADGSIEMDDLRAKLDKHAAEIAAIMITYPSTHGVFEPQVREVCELVHGVGGQVYIDGANLNAMVGLAQPGAFGGDVSHLNLHKTFAIPHGGGGPGVGPVCVGAHLVPFLPADPTLAAQAAAGAGFPADDQLEDASLTAPAGRGVPVSGTAFGSAGVTPITWAYIALMGGEGLTRASQMALVNANYISRELADYFPTLYTGEQGLVAHECILDLRELTKRSGVTAEDVSKRLMDFGFHAPTLAFPVPGTLMVEPTESEDKGELDRFITAMRTIRAEIDEITDGQVAVEDSVLRHAPFTAVTVMADEWGYSFSRSQAAFPVASLTHTKYFPPVRRIDNAYGDRNLMCSCPPIEAFVDPETDSAS